MAAGRSSILELIGVHKKIRQLKKGAIHRSYAMMKFETANRRDWQGFTRILEIMSLVDDIGDRSPEEIRQTVARLCELPPNPGQTMSLEEVVFWAGVASGMEFWRDTEEESLDPSVAEKMLVFSSIFAHSMKNAIVDLALGELEPEAEQSWSTLGNRLRH
jgi:hypothetical protein